MNENGYKYVSPPIMPGVRRLASNPNEHVVVDLQEPLANFIPSHVPGYNKRPRQVPIMSATGLGIEDFGGPKMLWRLIIFILVVGFIYYLIKQNKTFY
jgi:hypothetical protein